MGVEVYGAFRSFVFLPRIFIVRYMLTTHHVITSRDCNDLFDLVIRWLSIYSPQTKLVGPARTTVSLFTQILVYVMTLTRILTAKNTVKLNQAYNLALPEIYRLP